jgi:hypothetical protein
MMKYIFFLLASFVVLQYPSLVHAQDTVYNVRYLPANNIKIDGKITENDWKKCESLNSFVSPWKTDAIENTIFRSAYDDKYFYFSFEVSDNKIITSSKKEEIAATEADRVEIFFSPDKLMTPYYCFEIAPNELVYDYKAQFHRQFFGEWNATGVLVKASILKNKYTIEGAIPLSLIKDINGISGSIRGSSVLAGVFRADKDIVSSSEDDFTWISWIPPHADHPDFHIPSALGTFKF